jgi:transposase-like protein
MRYPASEKLEIIRLVEQSHLPARRTLQTLGILPSTFYRWYDRYQTGGAEALADRPSKPNRVWNKIPDTIRDKLVELRWMSQTCRPGNWPPGSPIRRATLSRNHRFIGCSRRMT